MRDRNDARGRTVELYREKRKRRLSYEVAAIRETTESVAPKLRMLNERFFDDTLLGFTLGFEGRTCIAGSGGRPEFVTKRVVAVFDVEPYPDAAPNVRLWSNPPKLYLPAAHQLAQLPFTPPELSTPQVRDFLDLTKIDIYHPCLFQGTWDGKKIDLPHLVHMTWAALTLTPETLNFPGDALNEEACRFFILHRRDYELPLEPPLRVNGREAHRPPPPRRNRIGRYVVEEVEE